MMKRKLAILSALSVTALPMSVAAEEAKSVWTGGAELGFVLTSGNTETQTVNGKVDLTKDLETWRNNAKLEALNTSEDESTSAEKYIAAWKSDYKFDNANFLFISAQYDDDRFSGFDYQASTAVGYGRRILDNETHLLDLEAGPGFRRSKISEVAEGQDDVEDEGILKLAGKYRYNFSKTAEFSEDLTVDIGEESTISKSVTAVKAQIVGKLAMKISYTVKHTSEVPAETKSTDRETALTLVYSI